MIVGSGGRGDDGAADGAIRAGCSTSSGSKIAIPENHLLRRINVFVTVALADLHKELEPHYSDIGRPSVDPELMIRMLIVGYCYGIRSERRLCAGGRAASGVPVVLQARPRRRGPASLDVLDQPAGPLPRERSAAPHLRAGGVGGHGDGPGQGRGLRRRRQRAGGQRQPLSRQGAGGARLDRASSARRARSAEYLAALDEAAEPDPDRKPPKVISLSDPSSAWTAKANKRVQFGYGLNYLIDIENAVIVDVEATPARTYDEVEATKTMIDRTERCFDLKPKRLAADTAYGTGRFLGWLVKDKKITPHIPVRDKSERDDGTFSRSDFNWDKRNDVYICPAGKVLRTTGTSAPIMRCATSRP